MEWRTIKRPGYLGKFRDEVCKGWDESYKKGNWRIMYEFGEAIVPRDVGLQIYTQGYFEFLKNNPSIVDWLCEYENVYDTAPSNIDAEFDFNKQETPNNHIHDISIRISLAMLGRWFTGRKQKLLHVRSSDTEGHILSPMNVPFHLPDLIYKGEIEDYPKKGKWWIEKGIPNSIEEFYQQNKLLQIRNE